MKNDDDVGFNKKIQCLLTLHFDFYDNIFVEHIRFIIKLLIRQICYLMKYTANKFAVLDREMSLLKP